MRKIGLALIAVFCCVALCGCTNWWELIFKSETSEVSTPPETSTLPPVTITVESGFAEAGDTVILPVTINADAHLVDADILLHYNPSILEPVLQYDAETDSERYAEPGVFGGVVRSEKTSEGCVYVLLAAADDGTQAQGTLFYVAFRLLSDTAENATVTPEISSCHVRANGVDVDATGALTANAGTVQRKTAESATATAADDEADSQDEAA